MQNTKLSPTRTIFLHFESQKYQEMNLTHWNKQLLCNCSRNKYYCAYRTTIVFQTWYITKQNGMPTMTSTDTPIRSDSPTQGRHPFILSNHELSLRLNIPFTNLHGTTRYKTCYTLPTSTQPFPQAVYCYTLKKDLRFPYETFVCDVTFKKIIYLNHSRFWMP